jgi:hypothetical protein
MASGIGLGVSLFVLVAAIGFTLATGGAAAPIGALVGQANEALKGLGTLLNTWATLETKLDSVIRNLNSADKAALQRLIRIYANTSKTAWDDLTNYALILQRAGEGTKIVEQNDFRHAA